MFKKIKIDHFRGISNLELNDLRQFNLFVGKNNCGKTSLLESICLLAIPGSPYVYVWINNIRGHYITPPYSWSVIFNKLDTQIPIRLHGEMSNLREKRELSIAILLDTNATQAANKPFEHFQKGSRREFFDNIIGLSIGLSISKNPGKKQPYEWKIWFEGDKLQGGPPENYIETLTAQFLTPVTIRGAMPLWLNKVLINKQEKKILEILRKVEPGLANLSIGADNILYCDMGFTKLLPLSSAGEGLNNLLAIILAIYETPNGVVLIDEIENGLHYSTQEILWEAIFEAAIAFNVQVFATTHSYENAKAFSSACEKLDNKGDKLRLFRIENEKDKIRLIDFNHEMLSTAIQKDWEVR